MRSTRVVEIAAGRGWPSALARPPKLKYLPSFFDVLRSRGHEVETKAKGRRPKPTVQTKNPATRGGAKVVAQRFVERR